MLTSFFALLFLFSCSSKRWVGETEKPAPPIEKREKSDVAEEWHDYLHSKGIHQSLCVQGLLERLDDWSCERVEVEKFDDRVELTCLVRKETSRETYWQRHRFVVKPPVLIKGSLDRINMKRHPAICIDTVQKIEVYQFEDPKLERIKLK